MSIGDLWPHCNDLRDRDSIPPTWTVHLFCTTSAGSRPPSRFRGRGGRRRGNSSRAEDTDKSLLHVNHESAEELQSRNFIRPSIVYAKALLFLQLHIQVIHVLGVKSSQRRAVRGLSTEKNVDTAAAQFARSSRSKKSLQGDDGRLRVSARDRLPVVCIKALSYPWQPQALCRTSPSTPPRCRALCDSTAAAAAAPAARRRPARAAPPRPPAPG